MEEPQEQPTDYFRTIDELLATSRYTCFWPKDKGDLISDYPELMEIPSIRALQGKPKDLLFVWFYAFRASPVVAGFHGDKSRKQAALVAVHGNDIPEAYQRYLKDNGLPEAVAEAVKAMRCIELGARTRERLMCERNIINAQRIIDIDVASLPPDWNEKKNYLIAVEKAGDIIAQNRLRLEGLSGVVRVEEVDEKASTTAARLRRIPVEQL